MSVDVITETEIERAAPTSPPAGDPANAPTWYVNIKSAAKTRMTLRNHWRR